MSKANQTASAQQFGQKTTRGLSAGLGDAVEPFLREIESLNEGIQEYDRRIAKNGQTDISGNSVGRRVILLPLWKQKG